MPDWFLALATHPVTLLAVGGGAGANARYWLGLGVAEWQSHRFPRLEFPWGTFLINVSGSIVLGFVAAAWLNHHDPARRNWYLLAGTGFCGGFTTFSIFSLETLRLTEAGRTALALTNVMVSVVLWLAAVWVGWKLGERLNRLKGA
jgi:CrcB protein